MKIGQLVAATTAAVSLSVLPASTAFASSAQADGSHVNKPRPSKKVNDHKRNVHPRVDCGGGDGILGWGGWGSIAFPGYLEYDGNVYNSCRSGTVYLYLHWSNFGSTHNKEIGRAGARQNHRVHFHTSSSWATYAHIEITVCESYQGWRCGAPIHV